MRTLIINAHPFPHDANAYSKKLEEAFKAEFRAKFDENELEILNLAGEWIPRLYAAMMTIFAKRRQNEPLDESEQKIACRRTRLMVQFKRCKRAHRNRGSTTSTLPRSLRITSTTFSSRARPSNTSRAARLAS